MTSASAGRASRRRLAAETIALAGAGLVWPQSWGAVAGTGGLVVVFPPCCVVTPFAVPILLAAPVGAWRLGVAPTGLVAFTAALVVGLVAYLAHAGDCTEFPPLPYLGLRGPDASRRRLHGRAAVARPPVGGRVGPALGGGATIRAQAVRRHRLRRVLTRPAVGAGVPRGGRVNWRRGPLAAPEKRPCPARPPSP